MHKWLQIFTEMFPDATIWTLWRRNVPHNLLLTPDDRFFYHFHAYLLIVSAAQTPHAPCQARVSVPDAKSALEQHYR